MKATFLYQFKVINESTGHIEYVYAVGYDRADALENAKFIYGYKGKVE